jgi:transcriptional regulator with XRE-family HTH domain
MENNKINVVFSENLKRLRKKRGLSQYDLADLTGISRRMIGHYENHAAKLTLTNIDKIARALKVKVIDLFKNDENDSTVIDPSVFDTRSLKKLQDMLSLPHNDRADLYRMLNKMLRKNQLEKEKNKFEEKS